MSTPIDTPPAIEIIARGLWLHGESVLLCRNLEAGYYYLPGGHVEFGESGAGALAREMVEEAGMEVRVGACVLVGECSFVQKGRQRHEVNLMFHVEHGPGRATCTGQASPPPPVPSLEPHIAFAWVPIAELSSADVRPRWLAQWIVQNARRFTQDSADNPARPDWVSVMSD